MPAEFSYLLAISHVKHPPGLGAGEAIGPDEEGKFVDFSAFRTRRSRFKVQAGFGIPAAPIGVSSFS